MIGRVLLEPTLTFELFEVFTIEETEDVSLAPTLEVLTNVTIDEVINRDVVSLDVFESDIVDPPLYFDVLPRFISPCNDVLTISYMDLSILEYLSVSCNDDIASCSPNKPTTHIFGIDDKSSQGELDEIYQFDFDYSVIEERVHLLMTMR